MTRTLDLGMPDRLQRLIAKAIHAGWQVKTSRAKMPHRPGWSTTVWVKLGSPQGPGLGGMCGTGFADDLSHEDVERLFESLLRGAFYTDT